MPEPDSLHRRIRRWKIAKWICFGVVAIAVALALGSAVTRLQQTTDLIDGGSTRSGDYLHLTERSGFRTILGLAVGCAGMVGYMIAVVFHERARSALKAWRQDERRARLAEMGVDEADL